MRDRCRGHYTWRSSQLELGAGVSPARRSSAPRRGWKEWRWTVEQVLTDFLGELRSPARTSASGPTWVVAIQEKSWRSFAPLGRWDTCPYANQTKRVPAFRHP